MFFFISVFVFVFVLIRSCLYPKKPIPWKMGRFQGAGAVFYLRHTFSFLSPYRRSFPDYTTVACENMEISASCSLFSCKGFFGYGSEVSIVDSGVDCSSRPRPRGAVPLCTIQYSILYTVYCILVPSSECIYSPFLNTVHTLLTYIIV